MCETEREKERSLTLVLTQGISRSMTMSIAAIMTVETAAAIALLQILSPLYSLPFCVWLQICIGKLFSCRRRAEYSSTR